MSFESFYGNAALKTTLISALKTGTLTLEDFGEENEATIEENNEGGI